MFVNILAIFLLLISNLILLWLDSMSCIILGNFFWSPRILSVCVYVACATEKISILLVIVHRVINYLLSLFLVVLFRPLNRCWFYTYISYYHGRRVAAPMIITFLMSPLSSAKFVCVCMNLKLYLDPYTSQLVHVHGIIFLYHDAMFLFISGVFLILKSILSCIHIVTSFLIFYLFSLN